MARWIEGVEASDLPATVVDACIDTVIDTCGLAFAARRSDYVAALLESWTTAGPCTVIGFAQSRDAAAAAMINGTAAHGEDFDNTFEGCPVHAGSVVVPAVLAVAEERGLSGYDALRGMAVGQELMCRLALVVRKGTHAAGFHPTAVIGAMGATAAVAATTGMPTPATANALGIAGSMASGIIEYLADGSWTKRMHAGWAAQSGLRAAAMGQSGFEGPATVFEGRHGFFRAFAPSVEPDLGLVTADLGRRWESERLAFKPYACGTMTQPFVDCAVRLAGRGIRAADIVDLKCLVGEGTVHRLWDPIELKRTPPTPYAAKFSTPYCIAVAFLRGDAGLSEFNQEAIRDPAVLALAERVRYVIDPDDEYPHNYTGRIRATLTDGRVIDEVQPHLRGGAREPLGRAELQRKCAANLAVGGADPEFARAVTAFAEGFGAAAVAVPSAPAIAASGHA
ncbi:MAG: MmgE/PrpD family protein [Rhodospirillaceae bacterium]|nr:MmgE/PrpD family protein [Rhodospirillaceae bacterium]